MTTYYNILDTIKNQLLQDPFCNSVTEGSIYEIDLSKQTMCPYAHIQVNSASINEFTNVFSVTVFCMDIVDKPKVATTDDFIGNDNTQDVLNTQYAVATRLLELMRRGSLRDDNFALLDGSSPNLEAFTERFDNFWAGWAITMDVEVPNEMTICGTTTGAVCEDAVYTITDTLGNVLYQGTIVSGGNLTQAISNSAITNTNASYTASVLSQASLELPNVTFSVNNSVGTGVIQASVPSVTDQNLVAPDGSAVVKYVDGTVISTNAVASGATRNITVPNPIVCSDATVTVNSATLGTVASGGTLNVPVLKSTGAATIGAISGSDFRIPNSAVANSDASYSQSVLATDSLAIPDSTMNFNGASEGTFVSVKTTAVTLKDESGTSLVPTSKSLASNTLALVVQNPLQVFLDMYTGKAVSHAGSVESISCIDTSDIFTASPIGKIQPSAYGVGKLIAMKPLAGGFDLDVVRNTTATRYNSSSLIETVAANVPRLDYFGVTCPSVLVEAQSTNLFDYSEDFANAYWTKTRAGITSDSIASPIASTNSDKMIPTAVSGNHFVRRTTATTNDSYIFSGFFKDGGYNIWLRFTGASFNDRVEFGVDLSDGSDISFIEAGTFTGSKSVVTYPNGWYRIEVKINVPSGEANLISSMFAYNGAVSFTPDGTSGFYVIGAQLEIQAAATSYIPTSGASATRNADVMSVTGLSGITTLTETFEDDSTNVISSPSTYTMSNGRIKKVITV